MTWSVEAEHTETVTFRGVRAATGPATWSQRSIWQWLTACPTRGNTNISWSIDLPGTTGVAGALAGLRRLTERHECLRTTVDADGQQVIRRSALPVPVWDLTGLPPHWHDRLSITLAYELGLAPLDPAEFPVRYGVVRHNGGFRALVAGSRFALDGSGYDVLRTELAALAAGGEPEGWDVPWQPLDQAAFEASAAGRRLNDAAQRYWRDSLRALPDADVPPGTAMPGARKHWSAKLISPAAAAAVDRYPMASAVLLAATADVVWRRFGLRHGGMKMIVSNRLTPRERNGLYCVGQDGLIVLDTAASSFDALVRRAGQAALRACRFSRYDPDELAATQDGLTGRNVAAFATNTLFNPHNLKRFPAEPGDTTVVDWVDPFHGADSAVLVSIWRDGAGLNIALMTDTELLGADEHSSLLHALGERLA